MGKGIVDKLKKDFDIEDTWLPLEIHPETPKEGKRIDTVFPKERMSAMTSYLKASGAKFGIDFNELNVLSNSHISLIAGEFAKDCGKFYEYHEEVFKAYFTYVKDIGNMDVILDIIKSIGLDIDKFKDDFDKGIYDPELKKTQIDAYNSSINSTPTFIINDKYKIVGAQSVDTFKDFLLKIENKSL